MKYLLGSLIIVCWFSLPAFGQNTSIQYTPFQPPNPNRQVPAFYNSNAFTRPGLINSSTTRAGADRSIFDRSDRLRKRSNGRVIVSEPIIILAEPDMRDRPKFD